MRTPEGNNPGCTLAQGGSPLVLAEVLAVSKSLLLLTKPGIVLAELLAGLGGALLASPSPAGDRLWPLLLCLFMAAAGAAMTNGLLDAAEDRKMPRLARRSRALETAGKGVVRTTALILNGGAALVASIWLPPLTLLLLAAASLGYTAIYTSRLKRRTPWSVLVGGIPGALPPLIGSAAVSGTVLTAPILLGLLIYVWQLPHFWFLALHCREQYRTAGVPVLPLVHGERATVILIRLCSLALVPCSTAFCASMGKPPVITALLSAAALAFAIFCFSHSCQKADYHTGFVASIAHMALILLTVIGNAILTTPFWAIS